jgi:hypothetical protein
MVERWLEILVVPFSTLFRRALLHVLGDSDPVVGALTTNELQKRFILLREPWSATSRSSHCRLKAPMTKHSSKCVWASVIQCD